MELPFSPKQDGLMSILSQMFTWRCGYDPPPPRWSDGMRCCRSDWPGLWLFCCYQLSCVVSQQSWFGSFFWFKFFPILPPPPSYVLQYPTITKKREIDLNYINKVRAKPKCGKLEIDMAWGGGGRGGVWWYSRIYREIQSFFEQKWSPSHIPGSTRAASKWIRTTPTRSRIAYSRRPRTPFPPTIQWPWFQMVGWGEVVFKRENTWAKNQTVTNLASFRWEKRLNFSINPRKLSIFKRSVSNRSEALVTNQWRGEHYKKKPNSTLLADNTRGLITTKQTKSRPVASAASHPITPASAAPHPRGGGVYRGDSNVVEKEEKQ